jgi:formylglycine-generating enzyme required for sulfatase activity
LVEAAKVADAGTAEERYTASLDEQTSEGVAPDGFKQMDDQPVVPQVGVSGDADQAYCDWLEQQCGGVLIKRIGE